MINIVVKHLKEDLSGFLIWLGIMALITVFVVSVFPYTSQFRSLSELFEALPPFIRAAYGKYVIPVHTLNGWLNVEYFSWISFILGFYAAIAGAGLISKEMEKKTLEVLLAQPVRRTSILAGKFLAFLFYLVLLCLACYLILILSIHLFLGERPDYQPFFFIFTNTFILDLFLGGGALVISTLCSEQKKGILITLGLIVAFYIVNIVLRLDPVLEKYLWITPFSYTDPSFILTSNTLPMGKIAVLLAGSFVLFLAAEAIFCKKDIRM